MGSDAMPERTTAGDLDDSELAAPDDELKALVRRMPPDGAISFEDLVRLDKLGEPVAQETLRCIYNAAFLTWLERRPMEVETAGTRLVAEWTRLTGRATSLPSTGPEIVQLAGKILVCRDRLTWNDVVRMPASSVVSRATERPKETRNAKWYERATVASGGTTSTVNHESLKKAVKADRLGRTSRGQYAIDDVCSAFPHAEHAIRRAQAAEKRGKNGE